LSRNDTQMMAIAESI